MIDGQVSLMCIQVSYTRAQGWVKELQKQEGPGIIIALAGNKADLDDLRAVEADVKAMFSLFCHFTAIITDSTAYVPLLMFIKLHHPPLKFWNPVCYFKMATEILISVFATVVIGRAVLEFGTSFASSCDPAGFLDLSGFVKK